MTPPTDRATRIPLIVTTALLAATGAGIVTAGPAAADGWTVTHPTYVGDAAPSPTPVRTTYPPKWIPPQPPVTVEPAAASPTTPGSHPKLNPFGGVHPATGTPAAPTRHPLDAWPVDRPKPRPTRVTVHRRHPAQSPVQPRQVTAPKQRVNALPPSHPHRPAHIRHIGIWTVQEEETLEHIARATSNTVDALMAANRHRIRNRNHIETGWVLNIPAVR